MIIYDGQENGQFDVGFILRNNAQTNVDAARAYA